MLTAAALLARSSASLLAQEQPRHTGTALENARHLVLLKGMIKAELVPTDMLSVTIDRGLVPGGTATRTL